MTLSVRSFRKEWHTLLASQVLNINGLGLFRGGSVQFGTIDAGVICAHTAESAGKGTVTHAGALDGQGLSHDRAATTEDLEIRHAPRAWRDIVAAGGRGERAESGGGRLGEERAHGPRLAQKSLHGGQLHSA